MHDVARPAATAAPMVLLHSLGTDRRLWHYQRDAALGACSTIVFETNGHGRTTWSGETSLDTWLADLHHELAAHDQVYLVGLSMGGIQAMAFAAAYPGKVRGLVVANSFASMPAYAADARIRGIEESVHRLGMEQYATRYLSETLTVDLAPGVREGLWGSIAEMDPEAYIAAARTTFQANLLADLDAITCPALVLTGANDRKVSPELVGELRDGIRADRLVQIERAGHLSCVENPDAFNAAVEGFILEIEKGDLVR